MNWYKEIASNTLFQILSRVATSGASFLITILVARNLGIDTYGNFAKIIAFGTLFYLLVDFGLNAVFLQKEDSRIRFKDLFYARLIFSIILMIAANIIAWILPYNSISDIGFSPEVRMGISLFSFTFITEAILYSSTAVFQRELSYEYFMVSSVVGSIATIFFVLVSTMFSHSLLPVILSYLLGGAVESGFALFFTREGIFPFSIDRQFVRKLTIETLPITLMLVFNLIYFRIDLLLLSFFKPSHDVAIYDLAYKFFDFLIALPLFLSNALYPSLLENIKQKINLKQTTKKYILFFAVFSLFVVIPMWIGAPLVTIIKQDFVASILPLRILLISLPIFFVTSILQWVLVAKKEQVYLAAIYFFSALLNIGLNIIFIPKGGYIASSIITGVSEAIVLAALWARVFRD